MSDIKLKDVLDLWVEITGQDPDKDSMTIGDFSLYCTNKEIQEAIDMDDSEVTAFLLLDYFASNYLDEKTFTINQIIDQPEDTEDYVSKSIKLYRMLRDGEMVKIRDGFRNKILAMLNQYDVENPETIKMANDMHWLAVLRRDALKSLNELYIHQFLHGEEDTDQPQFLKHVFVYWNINSLIKGICAQPSGISLNLVRHPVEDRSFFVYGIRNGGTVSILTDKKKVPHAAYHDMSRKPHRAFLKRIYENRFPYEIMDLEYADKGAFVAQRSDLVPYQKQAIKTKQIKDLNPDSTIWIGMMFSLIIDKFWKGKHKQQLSYTGEMLEIKDALIESPEAKALTTNTYKPISATPLKNEDVTTDNMKDEWGHDITRQNQWLEERYEHLVKDEDLNLMLPETQVKYLTFKDEEVTDRTSLEKKKKDMFFSDRDKIYELKSFDPTFFGTEEEVISEQRWYARYNKATIIAVEVKKEFKKREKEIKKWFRNAVNKNLDNLLEYVAKGELVVPNGRLHPEGFHASEDRHLKDENICRYITYKKYRKDRYMILSGYWTPVPKKEDNYDSKCAVNGKPISLLYRFEPTTPQALAKLAGCEVKDLPDVLQHYYKHDLYHGNSILSRVDPMEWVVNNPWNDLNFIVIITLSKTGYNELRKRYDLPPNKWWLEEKQED